MINHKYKCIFIHIPKTGGTTIENILREQKTPKPKGSSHKTIAFYKKKYPSEFKNYFKFACVRNPWDRLVSAFAYRSSGGNKSQSDKSIAQEWGKDFKNFLKKINTLKENVFLKPQVMFIHIDETLCVDYVMRFESFESEAKKITSKLSIPINEIYKVRQSKHKHYTEYYDEETKQIVAEKYAKDIEYFGYKFGD
jgi:hypothetical protein